MILVRYSCRYARACLDLDAAEKAVNRLINEYGRMIPEDHFLALAAVHRRKQIENDDVHRIMLHNLSVLEYVNGAPPWHDVHPIVLRLPKFKAVLI